MKAYGTRVPGLSIPSIQIPWSTLVTTPKQHCGRGSGACFSFSRPLLLLLVALFLAVLTALAYFAASGVFDSGWAVGLGGFASRAWEEPGTASPADAWGEWGCGEEGSAGSDIPAPDKDGGDEWAMDARVRTRKEQLRRQVADARDLAIRFDEALSVRNPDLRRKLAASSPAKWHRPLLRVGDVTALGQDHDWSLLKGSLKRRFWAEISCRTPLVVVIPLLPKETMARLATAGAEEIIGPRLLHAARVVRLARDLVNLRRRVSHQPSGRVKRPAFNHPSDTETAAAGPTVADAGSPGRTMCPWCTPRPGHKPGLLVHVWVPDELQDFVCRVVRDEFKDWPFGAVCRRLSQGLLPASEKFLPENGTLLAPAQQHPGTTGTHSSWGTAAPPPSSQHWWGLPSWAAGLVGGKGRRGVQCSYVMWGASQSRGQDGQALAQALCPTGVGISVDLDHGDVTMPSALPHPFWTALVRTEGNQTASEGLEGKGSPLTVISTASAPSSARQRASSGGDQRMTIVTAFSENHSESVLRLLTNLLFFGRNDSVQFAVTVFSMEVMSQPIISKLQCLRTGFLDARINFSLRSFDFSKFPTWMHIHSYRAGWWAWKAVMIWGTMVEKGGSVLWLDAGDQVGKPETLRIIKENIEKRQFVSFQKSFWGTNFEWTNANATLFLGVNLTETSHQCSGSMLGMSQEVYGSLLRPFFECSLTLQCISPDGASYGSHRQDQSAVSILAQAQGKVFDDYFSTWEPWGLGEQCDSWPGRNCPVKTFDGSCSIT